MRMLCLAIFTFGMMLALHPMPREPWGVLGMGDLFTGYVLAFVGATTYAGMKLRVSRPARADIVRLERRRLDRAA